MWKRRTLLVALALIGLAPFVVADAAAGKGKKPPKPPPTPPGEPEIACRYDGGKGKNKGTWLSTYDLNGNRSDVTKISVTSCTWSPDGQHIALNRGWGGEIWRVDVDGTDAELLHEDSGLASEPAWSPDGDTIAFAGDDVTTLYLIPAQGGTPQSVHSVSSDLWIESPTWNAAGTHLAFLEHDGGNQKDVRVIDLATGAITDVATISASFIEWARTGDVLLYAASGTVHTLDMASGDSTEVATGSWASWSPDDSEIVLEVNGTVVRRALATGVQTTVGKGRLPNWRR